MTAPMDPPGFPDPRQYPATDEGLRAALAALGDTPDAVASTLDRLGIRGRPGQCRTCPVALYLLDVTGADPFVIGDLAALRTPEGALLARCSIPEPVRTFIQRFDLCGAYPGLVDMAVTDAG